MLKPRFCVSSSIDVHLSQTETVICSKMSVLGVHTCPTHKWVYTLLTLSHDHECGGGKNAKPRFCVSLLTGIHLSQKKGNRIA